jgi:hypothetical protein
LGGADLTGRRLAKKLLDAEPKDVNLGDANSWPPKRSTCSVWRLRISMSCLRIRIATGLNTLRKIPLGMGSLTATVAKISVWVGVRGVNAAVTMM